MQIVLLGSTPLTVVVDLQMVLEQPELMVVMEVVAAALWQVAVVAEVILMVLTQVHKLLLLVLPMKLVVVEGVVTRISTGTAPDTVTAAVAVAVVPRVSDLAVQAVSFSVRQESREVGTAVATISLYPARHRMERLILDPVVVVELVRVLICLQEVVVLVLLLFEFQYLLLQRQLPETQR
jgi:hypothetical protein